MPAPETTRFSFETGRFITQDGTDCTCSQCQTYGAPVSLFPFMEGIVIACLMNVDSIFQYGRAKVYRERPCNGCGTSCIPSSDLTSMLNMAAGNIVACYTCQRCLACCNCNSCESCLSRTIYGDNAYCTYCSRCQTCDRCTRCPSCNTTINRRSCQRERVCLACCTCPLDETATSQEVRHISIHKQPHYLVKTRLERKTNPLTRLVAVEIEVAGVRGRAPHRVTDICKKWGANIVGDGSLPSYGFEINTAPAAGDHWIKEISEITDVLQSQYAFANERCGLHCHVDAGDFRFFDMRRLLFLYEKIEPALFSMIPAARRTNNYCRPCGPKYSKDLLGDKLPKSTKNEIFKGLYGQDKKIAHKRRANRYDETRYNAFNLHSWFYRKTTEYRMHHGTVDTQEIINWGMLLAGVLDFALRSSERNIIDLSASTMKERKSILKLCAPTPGIVEFIEAEFERYNPQDKELALNYRAPNY